MLDIVAGSRKVQVVDKRVFLAGVDGEEVDAHFEFAPAFFRDAKGGVGFDC